MGCYFPGWGVSKRGVLLSGCGISKRDGVLVYGMGC